VSLNGKHSVLLKRKAAFIKIRGEAGILNNYLFQILPQLLEMSQRERKSKIDWDLLTQVLLKHRNEIMVPDFRIISKKHQVWTKISEEMGIVRKPLTLYTYTACSKYGIRAKLNECLRQELENMKEAENIKRKAKESKVLSISVYICFLHIS